MLDRFDTRLRAQSSDPDELTPDRKIAVISRKHSLTDKRSHGDFQLPATGRQASPTSPERHSRLHREAITSQ